MDWDDLRFFLAAAEHGSLGAAAKSLKVEHTTVGRRLAALESALGVKLFLRTPAGLVLTAAGQAMLPAAQDARRAVEVAERIAGAHDAAVSGTVRLTISEAFTGFFVKRMGELKQRHPALVVEVLTGNQSLDLARGEADLAIRLMPLEPSDLIARKLGVAGWSMYATQSYLDRCGMPKLGEGQENGLAGHDVVAFHESLSGVPGALWLQSHASNANVTVRGNSLLSVMNAALIGMGLAVVPTFMGAAESTLVRVTPEVLGTRDIWLVVHPDVAKVPRVRAVMDFVAEIVEREKALWSGRV